MPYVSTEALVGAGLIVLLAFGYQHMTSTASTNDNNNTAAKKKNKKNKKKKAGQDASVDTPVAVSEAEEPPKQEPKKSKKGKFSAPLNQEIKPAPAPVPVPAPAPAPLAEERAEAPSFAAAAGGNPAPLPKPKTLAEKLVPKPRKTKVDDMLEPEDRPPHLARVMRVVQPEKVEKFADDYASSEWSDEPRTQDGGWNVVAAKKKPVSVSIGGGSSSAPSRASSNEPLTKLQRKNQKKAEMKRVAKEAEESDRLRRLAMHKKDLERCVHVLGLLTAGEKINSIYNAQQKNVVRERGRIVSGGSGAQAATLNSKGQLVWD